MFACQQSCSVILCSLSLLIAVSETGEEDDNICYARSDNKIRESKVSQGPLRMDCDTCVFSLLSKALLDHLLCTMLILIMFFRLLIQLLFVKLMIVVNLQVQANHSSKVDICLTDQSQLKV